MKELFLLILAIAVLWFLWFYFGGPERYDPNQGPLIKSPTVNQYYYKESQDLREF